MLFTRPINSITYEDVMRFCETGSEESFVLEYKRELPDTLAKTIAAFANTYGGLLVIGVDAKNGKPTPPFEGIAYDPKIAERIEAIIIGNIREPIFPEVWVCPPKGEKTFVLVRTHESALAPHRVDNRRIYVRTGQSSRPTEDIDWDRLQWLLARREKAEEFRRAMWKDADDTFSRALAIRGANTLDKNAYFGTLTLFCTPTFPHGRLLEFRNLEHIDSTIHVRINQNSFPRFDSSVTQSVHNGIQKIRFFNQDRKTSPHGHRYHYLLANTFGMLMFREQIGERGDSADPERRLEYHDMFIDIYMYLAAAVRFYEQCSYYGSIDFTLSLTARSRSLDFD